MSYDFSHILQALVPPERRSLSAWAKEHYRLIVDGTPTPFNPLKYQEEILNCMIPGYDNASGSPINRVVFKKSARVGYSIMLSIFIARHITEQPTKILCVLPTDEDANIFTKEILNPLADNLPILQGVMSSENDNTGKSSLKHRSGPGWIVSLASASTPRSFRAISRDAVLLDEVSGYVLNTGHEGSPVRLAIKRAEYSNRKIIIEGSTPTTKGRCQITKDYELSDKRLFHVPCPHCNHYQHLNWDRFRWEPHAPASVHYLCNKCNTPILPKDQRQMISNGEWRPTAKGIPGMAGFHINTFYSAAPNAGWANIIQEYEEVKDDPITYRTFVNTTLGEAWKEEEDKELDAGDVLSNLDDYTTGDIPDGVIMLTCGVDTQGGGGSDQERLECSIWGWGTDASCYLIYHAVIHGDPQKPMVWEELESFVNTPWPRRKKPSLRVKVVAIDSGGHSSESVYAECRKRNGWYPIKGSPTVDAEEVTNRSIKVVRHGGIQRFRHQQVYLIGTNKIKNQIYSRLLKHINKEESDIHLPSDLSPSVAEQFTSEHRIHSGSQNKLRWTAKGGIACEAWDCWVYAWAAMRIIIRRYSPKTVWETLERESNTINKNKPINKPNKQSSYINKGLTEI